MNDSGSDELRPTIVFIDDIAITLEHIVSMNWIDYQEYYDGPRCLWLKVITTGITTGDNSSDSVIYMFREEQGKKLWEHLKNLKGVLLTSNTWEMNWAAKYRSGLLRLTNLLVQGMTFQMVDRYLCLPDGSTRELCEDNDHVFEFLKDALRKKSGNDSTKEQSNYELSEVADRIIRHALIVREGSNEYINSQISRIVSSGEFLDDQSLGVPAVGRFITSWNPKQAEEAFNHRVLHLSGVRHGDSCTISKRDVDKICSVMHLTRGEVIGILQKVGATRPRWFYNVMVANQCARLDWERLPEGPQEADQPTYR